MDDKEGVMLDVYVVFDFNVSWVECRLYLYLVIFFYFGCYCWIIKVKNGMLVFLCFICFEDEFMEFEMVNCLLKELFYFCFFGYVFKMMYELMI